MTQPNYHLMKVKAKISKYYSVERRKTEGRKEKNKKTKQKNKQDEREQ